MAEIILEKFKQLPLSQQKELLDFADFLLEKYGKVALKEPKERQLGILKGKIKMMPDFDAPLEDFKDYM
ncbi:MAG: DUF2281 domain-containing protein [Flavobacterium sp.]|jgi:hypothetical protein|nr:DUF2281 domain-containing protein [Flavobacterium sp.]